MGYVEAMTLGKNFPVSEYYKDHILDGETISRGGGWWTAVLLLKDPKTQQPFVAVYRWQSTEDGWKTRKSISFKKKKHLDHVLATFGKFAERLS